MICVYCLHKKTSVTNSRSNTKTFQVWRRRSCPKCHKIFSTREAADVSDVLLISQPKGFTPFSNALLLSGVVKAIDHLPDIDEVAYWLAQTIQSELLHKATMQDGKKTISPQDIKTTTAQVLKRYNYPAYAKYAANHNLRIGRREQ